MLEIVLSAFLFYLFYFLFVDCLLGPTVAFASFSLFLLLLYLSYVALHAAFFLFFFFIVITVFFFFWLKLFVPHFFFFPLCFTLRPNEDGSHNNLRESESRRG